MSKPKFEEGQKRARDEARNRHRKEVRFWKGLTLATLAWGVSCLVLAFHFYVDLRAVWHTETPPSEQPLDVVTGGWYDKGK